MGEATMEQTPHYSNWINGTYQSPSPFSPAAPASEHSKILVINPATEATLGTIDRTPQAAVQSLIQTSQANFDSGTWSKTDASQKFSVLARAATLLRSRLPEFVALEVQQTGRPIREMKAQLQRIPEWLEYFASLARTHEGRVTPFKGPVINTLTRLPLGVVVQITPWNHPLLIATKKIAAALAAGNTVIVKPSESAPLSVLKLGEIMKEAGLPDGTLAIVNGYGRETGKWLCESKGIKKIDLTGGLQTYEAIALIAARNMVSLIAELGGKAPVCIFNSVGVEKGVRAALFASFIASGQTCVTGSRVLVQEGIWEGFVEEFVNKTRALRVGDPMDEQTQIGAVINRASVERCEGFVNRAKEEDGRVLCGGEKTTVDRKGFFFQPTIIECSAFSNLACNEVFGPVIAIIKCKDEAEMIAVANGTTFALGASVWTDDFNQAHRVAEKIDAGIVWINGHHLNDPSSPWGGFRESGMGKENGIEAFESYSRIKSTVINYGIEPSWFDEGGGEKRYG